MKAICLEEAYTHLSKDCESDIEVLKIFDGDINYIIAELKPLKTLSAHYHNFGSEIYHVLSGEGVIENGTIIDGQVHWQHSVQVKTGDVFEVKEKVVHQLKNLNSSVLRLAFIAPGNHMGSDRHFL